MRPTLLWAAGLFDLGRDDPPGKGNTGCFNDFNHVDATTMSMDDADNENEGRVAGMHRTNALGEGMTPDGAVVDLGPAVPWCTCILGSNLEPPRDVAHVQFIEDRVEAGTWCRNGEGLQPVRFGGRRREEATGARQRVGRAEPRDELPNRRRWTARAADARVVTLSFCTRGAKSLRLQRRRPSSPLRPAPERPVDGGSRPSSTIRPTRRLGSTSSRARLERLASSSDALVGSALVHPTTGDSHELIERLGAGSSAWDVPRASR